MRCQHPRGSDNPYRAQHDPSLSASCASLPLSLARTHSSLRGRLQLTRRAARFAKHLRIFNLLVPFLLYEKGARVEARATRLHAGKATSRVVLPYC